MKSLFFLLLFALKTATVLAQLDNAAFYRTTRFYPNQKGDVHLVLDGVGFTKNNEYFNRFADGYTLFGYQFNPRLGFCLSNNVRVDAGIFLRKDFGARGFYQAQPTFTIRYAKERSQLVFGTLQGSLNHQYIEPLYDFENVLNRRIENGVQYLYQSPKLRLDTWIDWQRMIYKNSPYQEEIAGGLSADYLALQNTDSTVRLTLPLQFTAQHHGGQIDATQKPLLTVFNGATGFRLEKKFSSSWLRKVYTANYIAGFQDHSNTHQLTFKNGYGIYVNLGLDTRFQNVMLSYWRGNGYVSLLGGQFYQSLSRSFTDSGAVEPVRQFVIARFMHDVKLTEGVVLTVRFEPYIDINTPRFEFSNSLYLNFNTDIFLKKVLPDRPELEYLN